MQEISEDLFQQISDLIYQKIGVHLPKKKMAMVNSRLSKRIRMLGLKGFKEYNQYLENNKQELLHLFNTLTTNVTHFFREKHHFDFLNNQVFPVLKAENQGKVRAWSAGCSSGEEVYTLAILLAEFFNQSWDSKILGTDINTEVLKAASKGVYHHRQVEKVPYELLTNYFKLGTKENEGLFKVKNKLKRLVKFKRSNLNQDQYPIKSKLDFIFCRNVFIYFNQTTRKHILNKFHSHLKTDGYLFLGHSESINAEDQKNKWQSVYKTVYQKRRV